MTARLACVCLLMQFLVGCGGASNAEDCFIIMEGYSAASVAQPRPAPVPISAKIVDGSGATLTMQGRAAILRGPPGQTFRVEITASGFVSQTLTFDVPSVEDPLLDIYGSQLAQVVWLARN